MIRTTSKRGEENAGEPAQPGASGTAGRLRLTVAYDGRRFAGWQSQARGDAVQDRLEAALAQLCGGHRLPVHGSGRTDAGVHAHGQVAHVDVPDLHRHSPEQWCAAVNAHLPAEIRVLEAIPAAGGFHARYAAHGKLYRYRVWNAPILDPFELGRAWHFPRPLDFARLDQAAQLLVGEHDFAAFSANRGTPPTTTVRTIHRIDLAQQGCLITLDFDGNGFLYKMVRLLTGSIVRCAEGRAELPWIRDLLAGRGKTSFAAPAEGLYLMRVRYGDEPPDTCVHG